MAIRGTCGSGKRGKSEATAPGSEKSFSVMSLVFAPVQRLENWFGWKNSLEKCRLANVT